MLIVLLVVHLDRLREEGRERGLSSALHQWGSPVRPCTIRRERTLATRGDGIAELMVFHEVALTLTEGGVYLPVGNRRLFFDARKAEERGGEEIFPQPHVQDGGRRGISSHKISPGVPF